MAIKTVDELSLEIDAAVNPYGGIPQNTGPALNTLLKSLAAELVAGAGGAPFVFQVAAQDDPQHYHIAVLSQAQAQALVHGEAASVVVSSVPRNGHSHDITFGYNSDRALFQVLSIMRQGEVPPVLQDEIIPHEVQQLGVDVGCFRGAYEPGRSYQTGDYVLADQQLYRSLTDTNYANPSADSLNDVAGAWELALSGGSGGNADLPLERGLGYASLQLSAANNQASGQNAVALGIYGTSIGYVTHTEGGFNQATSSFAHAEGFSTQSSGYASHAEGQSTQASGYASHAEGYATQASGYASHAEGYATQASGYASHAEGYATQAEGQGSHAEGQGTQATGYTSHAQGYATQANGNFSHAEGLYSLAQQAAASVRGLGGQSHNIGEQALSGGGYFFAGNVNQINGSSQLGQAQRTQCVRLARTYPGQPRASFRSGWLNAPFGQYLEDTYQTYNAEQGLSFGDGVVALLDVAVLCTSAQRDGQYRRASWQLRLLFDAANGSLLLGSDLLAAGTELAPTQVLGAAGGPPDSAFAPRLGVAVQGTALYFEGILEGGLDEGAARWVLSVEALTVRDEPSPTAYVLPDVGGEAGTIVTLRSPFAPDSLGDATNPVRVDLGGTPARFFQQGADDESTYVKVIAPANASGRYRLVTGSGTFFTQGSVQTGDAHAPVLNDFTPQSINDNEYAYVTLTGQGLASTTEASLNGQAVQFTILDETSVQLFLPPYITYETGPLTLTTDFGTVTTDAVLTVVPHALVTSVNYGYTGPVTASGRNLDQITEVTCLRFDTYQEESVTQDLASTADQLILHLPDDLPVNNYYLLYFKNSGGVVVSSGYVYTYVQSPAIYGISFDSGSASSQLTLTGQLLDSATSTQVSFRDNEGLDTPATLLSQTATSLVVEVPTSLAAGVYTLVVLLTVSDGASYFYNTFTITEQEVDQSPGDDVSVL